MAMGQYQGGYEMLKTWCAMMNYSEIIFFVLHEVLPNHLEQKMLKLSGVRAQWYIIQETENNC